jgi:hypothetical protein
MLAAERFGSVLILPLFLFQLLLLFAYGLSDPSIHSYFEALISSKVLTYFCLIAGGLLVFLTIVRFLILEVLLYLRHIVPNSWTILLGQIERQAKAAVGSMGIVRFTVVSFVEFFLGAFLAISLLFYGLSNSFGALINVHSMNFAEAAISILYSLPLVGSIMHRFFPAGLYEHAYFGSTAPAVLEIGSKFIFTTVVIGIVVRLLSFARSK